MARLLSCTCHTSPPPHIQYPVTSFFYWNTSWHWREGHFMTSGKFMNNCRLHFKSCKQMMQQILQDIAQVCYIKNKILTTDSMTMSHIFPTKWVHVYISPPIMLHFWNQWTGSDKKPCSLAYKTDLILFCIRSTQFIIRNSISVNNPLKNDLLWGKKLYNIKCVPWENMPLLSQNIPVYITAD